MKKTENRIEWAEKQPYELFTVIAEKTVLGWEFWEKSIWSVRWDAIETTPERVAKAERLARIQRAHQL